MAGNTRTVFYDDPANDLLVGVIPDGKEFNYFGYLKKMTLTLHNIKMMKSGRMPYHGAMFQLVIRGKGGRVAGRRRRRAGVVAEADHFV